MPELVSGRAKIWTQGTWFQSWCVLLHSLSFSSVTIVLKAINLSYGLYIHPTTFALPFLDKQRKWKFHLFHQYLKSQHCGGTWGMSDDGKPSSRPLRSLREEQITIYNSQKVETTPNINR